MRSIFHYDSSVAFLGTWGRFQLIIFFLLCFTILPNGMGSFSFVFLTDTPRHRCRIPEANLSQEWHGYSEDCVDGWVYSTEIYQSTVVSQYDLVCGHRWKQPLTTTIFFLGVLGGSFISGVISDKFGRKPVLFTTIIIQAVFTLVQIAAPTWEVIGGTNCGSVGEILTGNARVVYSSTGVCLGFTLGYMMLPLFAYFIRTWEMLLVAIGVPGLICIPLWWVLPESPMWLLSQGRVMEAEAIVRKAAKMNRVVAPEKIFDDSKLQASEKRPVEHYTVSDLLRKRTPQLLYSQVLTANCHVCRFSMSICYYGLSLNTSQLHSDPYISCFLSAVVEVPAYLSCSLAIRYLPRRMAVLAVFLIMGVALFSIQLVPQSILGLAVALEMLGKFGATAGTSLLFAFTAELYPTSLRNTASGLCLMVSRTGSYIFFKYLSYITLGILAMLSILATLFLPESFGHPLPETLQHMQKRQRCDIVFFIFILHQLLSDTVQINTY
uniref:Solute carrier family 22 member 4-like n=1 Tax=Hippocampus comes TaxID=109280 RepID=A0A3Q2Y353_HIPCM